MTSSLLQIARQRRLIALASLDDETDNILSFDRGRASLRQAANVATFASRRNVGEDMLKAA